MGMILIGALLVGCVLGVVIAAILGSAGLVVASKRAKTRAHVWRNFAVAFGVVLVLCVVVVYHFPYDIVRPGSDYDVAVKNLFLQGLAYCASPGVSALLAGWMTLLRGKTGGSKLPESNRPPPLLD